MRRDQIRRIKEALDLWLDQGGEPELSPLLDDIQDPEVASEISRLLSLPAPGPTTAEPETSTVIVSPGDPSRQSSHLEPPTIPKQIGPYRVLGLLGAGGMGSVYEAERRDREVIRRVAIKLLRQPFPTTEGVQRFRTERQILAAFDHPNIARLYDGGATDQGLPFLVMERVAGDPLGSHCDDRKLSVNARIRLFRKICSAVQYAHSRLVVHRDLKPSNVLVTHGGEPKLLDFGIAKLLAPERFAVTLHPTETGFSPLTPHFASPEQLRGEPITTVSDVFSLGVLLYELLTGVLPFRPKNPLPIAFLEMIQSSPPDLPSRVVQRETLSAKTATMERYGLDVASLSRRLAGDIDNIVAKALEPSPNQRYRSVEQLDDDLRRYLEGDPVSAREGTWRYRAGKFVRRHKAEVGAVMGFVGMSGTFSMAMARQAARISAEKKAADRARQVAEQAQQDAEAAATAEKEVSRLLVELFEQQNPDLARGELSTRELIREGIDRILERTSLHPTTRIKLLSTLGLVLRTLGENRRAVEVLEQAVGQAQDREDKETLEALINLGRAYEAQSKVESAESVLDRAEVMAERLEDPLASAAIANMKGIVNRNRDRVEQALEYFDEASRIYRQELGPNADETLGPRINAAHLRYLQDGFEAGIRETLEILEPIRSKNKIITVGAFNSLASMTYETGHHEISIASWRWTVIKAAELFGHDSRRFLRLLFGALRTLCDLGVLEEIERTVDSLTHADLPDNLRSSVQGEIHRIRGYVAMRRQDPRSALDEMSRAQEQEDPLSPMWLDRLAFLTTSTWAHLELEDLKGAEPLLNELNAPDGGLPVGSLEAQVLVGLLEARKSELEGEIELAAQGYQAALDKPASGVKYDIVMTQAHRRWVALLRRQGHETEAELAEQRWKQHLAPQFPLATPSWLSTEAVKLPLFPQKSR